MPVCGEFMLLCGDRIFESSVWGEFWKRLSAGDNMGRKDPSLSSSNEVFNSEDASPRMSFPSTPVIKPTLAEEEEGADVFVQFVLNLWVAVT